MNLKPSFIDIGIGGSEAFLHLHLFSHVSLLPPASCREITFLVNQGNSSRALRRVAGAHQKLVDNLSTHKAKSFAKQFRPFFAGFRDDGHPATP